MAMKAYESYKNVDLPWLKRVPEHWEVKRIGSLFSQRIEKVSDKVYAPLSVTKYGIVPQLSDAAKTNNGDDRKLVCVGDFVINSRSDRKGSSGLSKLEGSVAKINLVLKPRTALTGKYIHYLLKSNSFIEEYYRNGRGIVADLWTTGFSDMKTIWLPVPPKKEQDQIVRYLDWQNSRLNKLINAKKKEIALLEEQKQALISQAVTKGLDPNAPLKDSGIDWIGQIPEHWLLCNLKYLCSMRSGKNLTSIQITENGPYPVYGGNGVRGYYSQYNVNSKCLIVGRQGALCGNVHYVNEKIWATDHAVVTQVYNFIHLKFFYYLLTAMNLNRYASQTAAQPGLAVSNILNQKVCFPPINEQRKIAVYLERQCTFIDNLIDNINRIISLLQEYRTRLVADVVTGQIDVRNIAIPNYETVPETIDQPETAEESTISAEDQ